MLFCFDVDGTLDCDEMKGMGEYVQGIIPEQAIRDLIKSNIYVAIVSPSPYYPHDLLGNAVFNEYGSNEYRWKNVQDAIDHFKQNKLTTIYVDDLEANRRQLQEYGVKSISPEEFMKRYA